MEAMKYELEKWHSSCLAQIKSETCYLEYWKTIHEKENGKKKTEALIKIEGYKSSIQAYKNICQYLERILAEY